MTLIKPHMMVTYICLLVLFVATGVTQAADRDGRRNPPPPENEGATTVSETTVVLADESFAPSVVIQWNEAMLAAIRNGPPRPTVISRSLFMVHCAMYDAWTMYDEVATPVAMDESMRQPVNQHTQANKEAAISQAAYYTLIALFPAYEENTHAFSNLLDHLGYTAAGPDNAVSMPEGIGYLAAQSVLGSRQHDGSNAINNYAEVPSDLYPSLYYPVNSANPFADNAPGNLAFNPNRWQPLRIPTGSLMDDHNQPTIDSNIPSSYTDQAFLTPHWGSVLPFALTEGNQFRPPAPAQAGSDAPYTDALGNVTTHDAAYWQQVNQVLQYSQFLTDEQKVIAEYWADGPRSETPPGHWNALAHGISYRDQMTLDEEVKLFFALNGALHDSAIAAWDAKRVYDYIRPASAIRNGFAGQMVFAWGGPDQGTQMIPGEMWKPYQASTFVTPAFAEYVSGHSTFSAAAAEILTLFTGSNQFYDGETVLYEDFNADGIPDLLGQHIATVGSNKFEGSPTEIVTLQWETFHEAADEAGISRLYGGIHFQDGDINGRILGSQVGVRAYEVARAYWNGKNMERLVSNTNG